MTKYIEQERIVSQLEMIMERAFPEIDGKHYISAEAMLEFVKDVHAADVRPVVYCKDCKHRFNYDICANRGDNWFCGYGERRQDDV